jgi:molecular chaperone GrpE
MPESAPPGVAANAAGDRAEALTPAAVESVLADFRAWLEALPAGVAPAAASAAETVDLHTLLSQFVALRHEVTLQTRAARAGQEQGAEALRQLGEALGLLERAAPAAHDTPAEEAIRPLLKTLVDLYDALSLARRELQRVQEAVLPVLAQFTPAEDTFPDIVLEDEHRVRPTAARPTAARPSWLARLFGGERTAAGGADLERVLKEQRQRLLELEAWQRQAAGAAGRVRAFLDSVITGYTMSVQRLDRALFRHGLELIPTAGQPFDPERMEVLEVVPDSDRPANEVVDEVRRGYLWHGRLFRPAQVRVAKDAGARGQGSGVSEEDSSF